MEYKEFLRENPDYIVLCNEYNTENIEVMGERFLMKSDPYYSMSNRKVIMEYPYLKLGEH